jgi:hypothetical protein
MMESVTHRVDILFDVQQSGGVPLGSITQVASYTRRAAPNWGVGVFVGGGALMQALVNAYVKVFPAQRAKFTHAEDIPAALALIATRRAESAS